MHMFWLLFCVVVVLIGTKKESQAFPISLLDYELSNLILPLDILAQYSAVCRLAVSLVITNTSSSWRCDEDAQAITTPCSALWTGITCDGLYGNITSIYLPDVESGYISGHIQSLPWLRRLEIHADSFDGRIPTEIKYLTQLETFIIHTQYELIIPTSASMLIQLKYIDFYSHDGRLSILANMESWLQLETLLLFGVTNSISTVASKTLTTVDISGDFHYFSDDFFYHIGSSVEIIRMNTPALIKRTNGHEDIVFFYALPTVLMSNCNQLQVLEVKTDLQYLPRQLTTKCTQLTTLSLTTLNLIYHKDSTKDSNNNHVDNNVALNTLFNFSTLSTLQYFTLEVKETCGYFPTSVLTVSSLFSLIFAGQNYSVPSGFFEQLESLQTLSLTGTILNSTDDSAQFFSSCPQTLHTLILQNTSMFLPSLTALQQCKSLQSLHIASWIPTNYHLEDMFHTSLNLTTLSLNNYNDAVNRRISISSSLHMQQLFIGEHIDLDMANNATNTTLWNCALLTFASNTTLTMIPSFLRHCPQLQSITLHLDCQGVTNSSNTSLLQENVNTTHFPYFTSWQDVFPLPSLRSLSLTLYQCPVLPSWLWSNTTNTTTLSSIPDGWQLEDVSLTFYGVQHIDTDVAKLFQGRVQRFTQLAVYGSYTSIPTLPSVSIRSTTFHSTNIITAYLHHLFQYNQTAFTLIAPEIHLWDISDTAVVLSVLSNLIDSNTMQYLKLQSTNKPLPPIFSMWNTSLCTWTSLQALILLNPSMPYSNIYSDVQILNPIHACVTMFPKLRQLHLEGYELMDRLYLDDDDDRPLVSHIHTLHLITVDFIDLTWSTFLRQQIHVCSLQLMRVISASHILTSTSIDVIPSYRLYVDQDFYFTRSLNVSGFILVGSLSQLTALHSKDLDMVYLPNHELHSFTNDIFATSTCIVLTNNAFEGNLSIPSNIVITASYIDISHNLLTGNFPTAFFAQSYEYGDSRHNQSIVLIPPIVYLNFAYNSLVGTIPSTLFYLPWDISANLHHYNMNDDDDDGVVDEIEAVNTFVSRALNRKHPLQSLYMGYNEGLEVNINDLFDTLNTTHALQQLSTFSSPSMHMFGMLNLTFLQHLSNLLVLNCSHNAITGTLPTNVQFYNLQSLDLSWNQLSGNFTSSSYLLPATQSNLQYLHLSHNVFTGYFEALNDNNDSDVIAMKELDLSHNALRGSIQLHNWTRFTSLQILSLTHNQLSGNLPCITGDYLYLDVSYNQLSGSIPGCMLRTDLLLDLRSNAFSGEIPDSVCELNSPLMALYLTANPALTCYPACTKIIQNDFIDSHFLTHCPSIQDVALCAMVDKAWMQQSIQLSSFLLPVDFMNTGSDTKRLTTIAQSTAISYSIEVVSSFTNCPHPSTPILSVCLDALCTSIMTRVDLSKGSVLTIPYASFTLFYKQLVGCFYFTTLKITSKHYAITGWSCITKTVRVPIDANSDSSSNSTTTATATNRMRRRLVSLSSFEPSGFPTSSPSSPPIGLPTSQPSAAALYKDVEVPFAVSPCTWTGITCGNHPGRNDGAITTLSLKAMDIEASLTGDEFAGFEYLEILDLSFNKFHGAIPRSFGNISQQITSLDFTSNSFTQLNLDITLFPKLSVLKLGSNAISSLPPDFVTQAATMPSFTYLELYANELTGTLTSAFCQPNISIKLERNTMLTCWEDDSEGFSTSVNSSSCTNVDIVASGSIVSCAPTPMPSTSPTYSPTLRGSNSEIPGGTNNNNNNNNNNPTAWKVEYTIIIVVVLTTSLLLLCTAWYFYDQQRRTKTTDLMAMARQHALLNLPLHKLVVEDIPITVADIEQHRDTFKSLDYDDYTVLDWVLMKIESYPIGEDAFFTLVSHHLPIDIDTNDLQDQEFGWSKVIMLEDPKVLKVVDRILTTFPKHCQILANSKNNKGRANIDMASVPCYTRLQQSLYLHKQFKLFPTSEHISDTCEVYFAHRFQPTSTTTHHLASNKTATNTTTNNSAATIPGGKNQLKKRWSARPQHSQQQPPSRMKASLAKFLVLPSLRAMGTTNNKSRYFATTPSNKVAITNAEDEEDDDDEEDEDVVIVSNNANHKSFFNLAVASRGDSQATLDVPHDAKEDVDGDTGKLVVLKFIRCKVHFQRELDIRLQQHINDPRYTVPLLHAYDGDQVDRDADQLAFRQDAINKGFVNFPYCLVLAAAEQNLKRYIDRSNIAGKDREEVLRIAKHILTSLHYLHSQGIVHGDLKPTNIVKVDTTIKLIDFDASANMSQHEYLGNKVSTLYCPPEMLYLVDDKVSVKWNYQDADRDPADGNNKVLPASNVSSMDLVAPPQPQPQLDNNPHMIETQSNKNGNQLNSSSPQPLYERVLASTKHDMWSFGVLLYFFVTGSPLFLATTDDNIALPKDLLKLVQWSDDTKNAKLDSLSFTTTSIFKNDAKKVTRLRNLLSYLLHKEPTKRLSAAQVLQHPFFTDKEHIRLAGEEMAEFDVFLSYRVACDLKHVLCLYDKLQAKGIKVWLDRYCLESGKNWEQGFCEGLVKSAHFVCLVSRNAINNPTQTTTMNFTTLHTDGNCDNVFLEWRMALELLDRDLLQGIFPVFIGDVINAETQEYGNYFTEQCFPVNLQPVVVHSVENKVLHHLDHVGLGHPYRIQEDATVTKTYADITANQGGFVEGEYDVAMEGIVEKIVAMIQHSKKKEQPASSMSPRC